MSELPARKFGANNGRVVGWLTMIIGIVTIGLVVADGMDSGDATAVSVVGLAMVLVWAILLRPTIVQEGHDLVLRQPFSDIRIPLGLVEFVNVRLFTVVSTPEKTYHSSAFARSRRHLMKRDAGKEQPDPQANYVDLVEEQINRLAEDARAQKLPTGPITRTPAWLEIGGAALLAVLAVVLIIV